MKTKISNKLNIVLIAIALLLVFVVGRVKFGNTNSWLVDKDKVGFTVTVANINIKVNQTITQTVDQEGEQIEQQVVREITTADNKIYFGTNILEADKWYDLNVTISNDELGSGFYIRCQALAVIDGTTYNINNCITNQLYKDTDGWMYTTQSSTSATRVQMTKGETRDLIDTITFPSSVIGSLEGKHVSLYLYIEGSPSQNFDI